MGGKIEIFYSSDCSGRLTAKSPHILICLIFLGLLLGTGMVYGIFSNTSIAERNSEVYLWYGII